MTEAEKKLRDVLTEVRLAPAYQAAVEKGVREARAQFTDNQPAGQLRTARRVALATLAAQLGWDVN